MTADSLCLSWKLGASQMKESRQEYNLSELKCSHPYRVHDGPLGCNEFNNKSS